MAGFHLAPKTKLVLTIIISCSFFVAELTTGFYTHSLALIADAFHYLCDIISFVVALLAIIVSERTDSSPAAYTYGWQRAQVLGAFFNGVFLIALGLGILVQAIERFVDVQSIDHPLLVLLMGAIGLGLNVLVLSFLHVHSHGDKHGHSHGHSQDHRHDDGGSHAHEHSPDVEQAHAAGRASSREGFNAEDADSFSEGVAGHHEHRHYSRVAAKAKHDLGLLGVVAHVIGDAINNIGVIVAAAIIWKAEGHARYYADPAAGVFIAIMIMLTARPLTKSSGKILLQIAPPGVEIEDVKHDLEKTKIPGVESVHELHIWQLDESKSIATAHVVCEDGTTREISNRVKTIKECLHAYGVHSATMQTEMASLFDTQTIASTTDVDLAEQRSRLSICRSACGPDCDEKRCCGGHARSG